MIEEVRRLYQAFPEHPMKPLTSNQNEKYKKSKRCHICSGPFTLKEPKVRDDCHYTGNYRGAAHRIGICSIIFFPIFELYFTI